MDTDPRMLELEKSRIFYKTWQPVGRVDQVRRVGDYFACEVVGQPLVISRGIDEKLRGYYNVCMHRAGPVAWGREPQEFFNVSITVGRMIWMEN